MNCELSFLRNDDYIQYISSQFPSEKFVGKWFAVKPTSFHIEVMLLSVLQELLIHVESNVTVHLSLAHTHLYTTHMESSAVNLRGCMEIDWWPDIHLAIGHCISLLVTPCHALSLLVASCHTLSHLVTICHSLSHFVSACHSTSPSVIWQKCHHLTVYWRAYMLWFLKHTMKRLQRQRQFNKGCI